MAFFSTKRYKSPPCNTKRGYESIKDFLETQRNVILTISWDEWRDKIKRRQDRVTDMDMYCDICKIDVHDTPVMSLKSLKHPIQCGCHTRVRWNWPAGFVRLEDICQERYCTLVTTWEDYKDKVHDSASVVHIQCMACDEVVKKTNINSFVRGRLGCGCYNKTEHKVRQFVRGEYGTDNIGDGCFPW